MSKIPLPSRSPASYTRIPGAAPSHADLRRVTGLRTFGAIAPVAFGSFVFCLWAKRWCKWQLFTFRNTFVLFERFNKT